MHRLTRFCTLLFLFAGSVSHLSAKEPKEPSLNVLMLVGGHAHDYATPPARLAERLSARGQMTVRITSQLTAKDLAATDVLIVNTCATCDELPLDEDVREPILDAIRKGKGLVALHCAVWSFQEWPEWRELIGGLTEKHAAYGPFAVSVLDPAHPAMLGVGNRFEVTDEAYFVEQRDPSANVLVRTKERPRKADGSLRPGPEPQVWTKQYGQGRVFVSTFGHDEKSLGDERIITLLHNGIRWAGRIMPDTPHNVLTKAEQQTGWELLFNGRDLQGWTGDTAHWSVENGELVGRTRPAAGQSQPGDGAGEASVKSDLPHNMFLTHEGEFGDFVLKFWVRLRNHNSGVQIRSRQFPENVVKGYQPDIADQWYGSLYEEGGTRGVLANGWKDKGETVVVLDGWNEMTVRAEGPRITIMLNALKTVDYTEKNPDLQPAKGIIALQLHAGPPMEVRFRDIRIQRLDH